jgi:hypothetical protein
LGDGKGWLFSAWSRYDREGITVQPTVTDLEMSFLDADSAADYFRRRYANEL